MPRKGKDAPTNVGRNRGRGGDTTRGNADDRTLLLLLILLYYNLQK